MAGNEAENPRQRPEDALPIVQPVDEYHSTEGRTGDRTAGAARSGLEDERRVANWPFVVGAVLLVVIIIVGIVIVVTVV
jgi:hypothetical protein